MGCPLWQLPMGSGRCGGDITTSANGTAWTKRTSNVSTLLTSVHYANSLWVAVGGTRDFANNTYNSSITTSADGATWTERTSNLNNQLDGIHYANGLWVVTGGRVGTSGSSSEPAGIITSTNGTTWTRRTASDGTDLLGRPATLDGILLDVHYANNLWVAVGVALNSVGDTIGSIATAP